MLIWSENTAKLFCPLGERQSIKCLLDTAWHAYLVIAYNLQKVQIAQIQWEGLESDSQTCVPEIIVFFRNTTVFFYTAKNN